MILETEIENPRSCDSDRQHAELFNQHRRHDQSHLLRRESGTAKNRRTPLQTQTPSDLLRVQSTILYQDLSNSASIISLKIQSILQLRMRDPTLCQQQQSQRHTMSMRNRDSTSILSGFATDGCTH